MSDRDENFDIDDPELPKAIKKKALASGGYPYPQRMESSVYDEEMYELQKQLVLLQAHLAKSSDRVMIIFEGRDAAGKGGTIKRYMENLNPRYNLIAALPKPNDRERTQWYFQRYVEWFPAGGETVLFDRSWYNRAGVEPVMGFCTPEQTEQFLDEAPEFEKRLSKDGIHLFKFWLSIGREMQLSRFHARRHDPLKVWKLSPVDLEALNKWDAYSSARDVMLKRTDHDHGRWNVIRANDKRRTRIAVIRAVLDAMDYEGKSEKAVGKIDRKIHLSAPDFLKSNKDD